MKLTAECMRAVVNTIDGALIAGIGQPAIQQTCVMGAIALALGLPHSDNLECEGVAVRAVAINLNDAVWSTNEARAAGMMRLGVASVGSNTIDQSEFAKRLAELTIRRIVPIALRAAAELNPKCAAELVKHALNCEDQGSEQAAGDAARDNVLRTMAAIVVDVLVELKSPGAKYLYLCEEAK